MTIIKFFVVLVFFFYANICYSGTGKSVLWFFNIVFLLLKLSFVSLKVDSGSHVVCQSAVQVNGLDESVMGGIYGFFVLKKHRNTLCTAIILHERTSHDWGQYVY